MTAHLDRVVGPLRILRYGPHDDQRVEMFDATEPSRGIAVLIHGGYWRAPFTVALMHPLVPEFTARGWTVANIEYRRGNDGWTALHEDLGAAMAAVRAEVRPAGSAPAGAPDAADESVASVAPIAIVGHSVGGQLALLAGREGDAIVALAPVTDLVRGYLEGIGDAAVAEFFRASPEELPDVYAAASPMRQLPPRGDVLVVHGDDDARVPVAHSLDYVEAARSAGAEIELVELAQLSHLDAIAPDAPHWGRVHEWLDQRIPAIPR